MTRRALGLAICVCAASAFAADKPTRFWNLTSSTVTSLRLSHAGSGEYGDNVALGDADGVDHDERVNIENLPSGRYDLELKFKGGRVCLVRHVEIVTGKVFSVEDKALTSCTQQ
ncbi:MAG: hypothetical protein KGM15_02600 [Pseudomonadota bacterium]|nr:hypothetical protein [Pseudomonadota bacterium]